MREVLSNALITTIPMSYKNLITSAYLFPCFETKTTNKQHHPVTHIRLFFLPFHD